MKNRRSLCYTQFKNNSNYRGTFYLQILSCIIRKQLKRLLQNESEKKIVQIYRSKNDKRGQNSSNFIHRHHHRGPRKMDGKKQIHRWEKYYWYKKQTARS